MKTLTLLFAVLLGVVANASEPLPENSLYHLTGTFTNQDAAEHRLDLYRDHPVMITMLYGSCRMSCPLLIDTMRAVERSLPEGERAQLRVLLVSIDHENDTPEALAKLASERRIDTSRWTLARADARTVRKLAALLGVQYRKLPEGGYNHSSIVTVLGPSGTIEAQSSIIGQVDPELVAAIERSTNTR
jgi:protein SCO1/2